MSHFIHGTIAINEPNWIQEYINTLSDKQQDTARSYWILINKGYFPIPSGGRWVNGDKKWTHVNMRTFSMKSEVAQNYSFEEMN